MSRVNPKMYDINMMDGHAFLTWLQKLGRISEDILLGNLAEKSVTLDHFNFSEAPTPSSVASVSRTSPSLQSTGGLSLPNINSHRNASSPANLFAASPSAEVIAAERSVSRGVGGNDSISSPLLPFRSFSPPRTSESLTSNSPTSFSEEDPYLRYMTVGKNLGTHHSLPQLYREGSPPVPNSTFLLSPSSHSSSPTGHHTLDGNEGSIMSAVTDSSSLMFSPIRPLDLDSSSASLDPSLSSLRQPMVASLLGNNPWNKIDSLAAARKRGYKEAKKRSQERIPETNQSPPRPPSLSSSAPSHS